MSEGAMINALMREPVQRAVGPDAAGALIGAVILNGPRFVRCSEPDHHHGTVPDRLVLSAPRFVRVSQPQAESSIGDFQGIEVPS